MAAGSCGRALGDAHIGEPEDHALFGVDLSYLELTHAWIKPREGVGRNSDDYE